MKRKLPHIQGPQFERFECPPASPHPFIPLMTAPSSGERVFIHLGGAMFETMKHWDREHERVLPHLSQNCPHCVPAYSKPVYNAYLCGYDWHTRTRRIVELTEGAVRYCPFLRTNAEMRGRWFKIYRLHQGKNGPVKIEPMDKWHPQPWTLPAPYDLQAALCRLWGYEQIIVPAAGPESMG